MMAGRSGDIIACGSISIAAIQCNVDKLRQYEFNDGPDAANADAIDDTGTPAFKLDN
jgi:hypothetical protein